MKTPEIKFSQYPFIVPTEKRVTNKLDKLIGELKECGSPKTASVAVRHWNKYGEELGTELSLIYVKYSVDTKNVAYKKAQERMDELSPLISKYSNIYEKMMVKASFRKDLEKIYGKYLFKMYDSSLKAFDEKIMPELAQENKLVSQYDAVLGGAQINFRGEVLNLSQLGKYMQDKDRDTRKEAAQAMDKWLGEHEKEIGDIYSQLVTLRDQMAKKLGFKNFTELGYLRLDRIDYNAKMVKKYREQIATEVVPVCQKLYKQQMKGLKIKNPQYYDYNLTFASGNANPIGDVNYIVDQTKAMFTTLSSESQTFINFMVDNELLDLVARQGKAPGGYCTYFPLYKSPFIFANFNGTADDVFTLAHECGHAFQAYLCSNIKIPEYQNPTLESCEIHSMSMEFFAWPYLEKFFGAQNEKAQFTHLKGAIEFLPYGISVDEFQHWVYEHPTATHEERCAIWRDIENRYTPHKKYDDTPTLAKGTYWMRQSHIFGTPFYYIDYTLAQVVAFEFFLLDRKNHEKAWKKYVKFTKCGGKYPFVELLEKNHLKNPFEDGTIHKIIGPLVKVLKGFDQSKF